MREVDVVVIGSGHNGLVAAAYLAKGGWDVEVLERNDRLGGAVTSEELTRPGFVHDTFSSWHPLFTGSLAYAELGAELEGLGLHYLNTEVPTGVAHAEGSLIAHRDPSRTAAQFRPPDRDAFMAELERLDRVGDLVAALLGNELHARSAAVLAARLGRRLGRRELLGFLAGLTASASAWLERTFEGDEPGLLYAPWVLHTGLAPGDAGGGFQLLALAGGLHAGGMPVVAGGSGRFVEAFRGLIEKHGGATKTGAEVERVVLKGGRAVGVLTGGEEVRARRGVVAGTTPAQLYGRLLSDPLSGEAAAASVDAGRFRPGRRAGMQIHVALSTPLRWRQPELDAAAVVHLADGPAAVELACAQAAAGLLPSRPTVVVGQPTVVDPSRAPEGAAILWIQLQEVPYEPSGDAAGELDAGGHWTDQLADAYADRVIAMIAAQTVNLEGSILERRILTPVELERRNPNFERGDPYGGSTELDQSFLWRPLARFGSHRTPIEGLWQIGASTYPGPGLNAASGRMVALRLLGRRAGRRARE